MKCVSCDKSLDNGKTIYVQLKNPEAVYCLECAPLRDTKEQGFIELDDEDPFSLDDSREDWVDPMIRELRAEIEQLKAQLVGGRHTQNRLRNEINKAVATAAALDEEKHYLTNRVEQLTMQRDLARELRTALEAELESMKEALAPPSIGQVVWDKLNGEKLIRLPGELDEYGRALYYRGDHSSACESWHGDLVLTQHHVRYWDDAVSVEAPKAPWKEKVKTIGLSTLSGVFGVGLYHTVAALVV